MRAGVFNIRKGRMKLSIHSLLAALAGVAMLTACQTPTPRQARHPEPPGIAETLRFDMVASATGRPYRIHLYQPPGPAPEAGWPVAYLIDGNATFPMLREAQRRTSLPQLVVVGIGYPTEERFDAERRYYDLTPPTNPDLIPLHKDGPPRTGGRDAFLAFMLDDLKPTIESHVPVDRTRQTLFGHSLGGLFALHVLFEKPGTFQNYVAADPSIWWNGRSILKEMATFRGHPLRQPARLLIETGGAKRERPNISAELRARLEALRGGPNGMDVAAALRGMPKLEVHAHRFEKEDHGSMLPLAVADTLPFALGITPEY